MEDLVTEQKVFHFGAEITQRLHDRASFINEARGKIVFEPTNAVKVGMEASARSSFDEVQHVFAIAERHEHGRDSA